MKPVLIAALLLALSGTVPAFAQNAAHGSCDALDPKVAQMLRAMSNNIQRIDYSGVVTLQRGGDMQIMELSHRVDGETTTEQLSRLTGQDARIERSGHDIGCLHPGHELLRSGVAQGSVCTLASHYRFLLGPGERIAGRQAVRLRAEPRDMYRFGHVFELDSDTALMLKSTTLAADKRVLEQFQFASLTMSAQADKTAAVVEHDAQHPHPHDSGHLRGGPPWKLSWLPQGFLATDGAPAVSQRKSYTDGLASFSVFVEPLSKAIKPGEGVERQGSTVAYTRGVMLRQRPVLVTVLGEIPTNTARMLADSVRLQ